MHFVLEHADKSYLQFHICALLIDADAVNANLSLGLLQLNNALVVGCHARHKVCRGLSRWLRRLPARFQEAVLCNKTVTPLLK